MTNIFVYHARDREGAATAAFIRLCDEADQFQFLPVERLGTMRRMRAFLERQGLSPDGVNLPFVVVLREGSRSVLHGPPLEHWIGGLVDAYLQSPMAGPETLWNEVIAPHLADATVRLVQHAATRNAAAPETAPPPPPPAFLEELPEDTVRSEQQEEGMDEDNEYHTMVASVPERGGRPRRNATFDRQAIMQEGNQREGQVPLLRTRPAGEMVKAVRRHNGKEKETA